MKARGMNKSTFGLGKECYELPMDPIWKGFGLSTCSSQLVASSTLTGLVTKASFVMAFRTVKERLMDWMG
jgi:hypothetical protein